MDFDELYSTGNEILNEVNHAINSGDFTDLSQSIRNLVADAIRGETGGRQGQPGAPGKGAAGGMGGAAGQPGNPRSYAFGRPGVDVRNENMRRVASFRQTTNYASGRNPAQQAAQYTPAGKRTPFLLRSLSKMPGILKMIGGIIASVALGFFELTMGIASLMLFAQEGVWAGIAGLFVFGVFGVIMGLMIYLAVRGKSDIDLIDKYYRYGKALGNKPFFSVKDLAAYVGIPENDLREDLEKMMKKGYLPQAHFDTQKTTVMLTREAYEQYLAAENGRRSREAAGLQANLAAARQTPQNTKEAGTQDNKLPPEVQTLLTEGNNYLKVIREVNDEIPDTEVMSDKLYKLEGIMRRIFAQVEKDPSCASELRKLMNYYLPTTEKLLRAYVELDKQPDVGENIRGPKREIEQTLDTINDAFEKLLDSLFRDMAWDISSDISVMKTMMAQDGLTESELTGAAPDQAVAAGAPDKQETKSVQVQTSDGSIITLQV